MENVSHTELEQTGPSEREIEKSRQLNWLMHGFFCLQLVLLAIEVGVSARGHMPPFQTWIVFLANPIPYLLGTAAQKGIRQMVKEGQMTEKGAVSCIESVNSVLLAAYVCLSAIVSHHFVN